MGLDIFVMNGRDYHKDKKNEIYHATYTATCSFREQSPTFNELVTLVDEYEEDEFTLEKYSNLIPKFKKEKDKLEEEGNTIRGKDIGSNAITIYDCIEGCYRGLQRAKRLGKKIRIF